MQFITRHFPHFFLVIFLACYQPVLKAQCTSFINSFPYDENFESGGGNWNPIPGTEWELGLPAKSVINTAGSGSNSWIVGGVNGNSYSPGNSELRSPCFNFSSLVNPEISFKIFWESELKYDGANCQYSLDGGSSWTILGSENSNADCSGINWYNYSPVNFLGGAPGWSGNIQSGGGGGGNCLYGSGSGTWLTARHSMTTLAGEPSVMFRFSFGAGTQCNEFNGVAIDDIHIGEAPPNIADFTYTCNSNRTVQFTNNSLPCQTGWAWNFGDPASGPENTSATENPVHIFSAPGTYSVSLVVTYSTGSPVIVPPKNITVLDVSASITNSIECNGDQDGSILLNASGGTGLYNFSWNTTPPQFSPAVNNLGAGTYVATVTATNACAVSIPIILSQPALLSVAAEVLPAKCGYNNGSISAAVSGGILPYDYLWSNGNVTAGIQNLSAGDYTVVITDANGCSTSNNSIVEAVVNDVNPFLGGDTTICPGQTLKLYPGNFANYIWQDNSTGNNFAVSSTGTYQVKVTDNDGCIGTDEIKVTVDCKEIYFPTAFTPGSDGLNEAFGPIGDLGSLKKFSIVIYNRYGSVVFSSSDPFLKWDGSYQGKGFSTQSFIWIATFNHRGRGVQVRKGTITLVR